MLQLLLRTIALTAADLVSTQALQIVMHRIQATAQVVAIVARWAEEGVSSHLSTSHTEDFGLATELSG